jgi:hypothetical protein
MSIFESLRVILMDSQRMVVKLQFEQTSIGENNQSHALTNYYGVYRSRRHIFIVSKQLSDTSF